MWIRTPWAAGLTLGTVSGFTLIVLITLQMSATTPGLVVLPLVVPLCLVGLYVMAMACAGSAWAILTVFAIVVFVNDASFRTKDAGDIGLDWQNGLKFLIWAGGVAIGLANLGRVREIRNGAATALFAAYLLLALASTIYSGSPLYSFATAMGMLSMLLLAMAVTAILTERQVLVSMAIVLWIFVLVGWVVYFVAPDLGRSPFVTSAGTIERICGIAGQANSLGKVLAVFLAAVFLLWWRGYWGVLSTALPAATGLFTLLAADSRSSLLAICIGIALVVSRRALWMLGLVLLVLLVATIVLQAIPLREILEAISGASRSGDATEVFTLTGRTSIWDFTLEKIALNPWLGYGYNAGKFILPEFLGIGILVEDAHNMWLQNLLSVGIVGTGLLTAALIMLMGSYLRAPDPVRDIFMILVIVYGITASGAFGVAPTLLTLGLFLGIAGGGNAEPPSMEEAR